MAITPRGIWADGDDVIVRVDSTARARDGKPYNKGYLYILTMKDARSEAELPGSAEPAPAGRELMRPAGAGAESRPATDRPRPTIPVTR
ncbi:hypothetical protein [Myceligenerans xiligouense]|uniref:hypothetical protein n=1 Tax=Myceligenerans xiligouense TaxID=253184 RepID=UPI000F4E7024|nr:hypothetical protein [Myceligenerans xiligouense]